MPPILYIEGMQKTETTADTTYTDELRADADRLDRMIGKTWPTTIAEDINFDPEAEPK